MFTDAHNCTINNVSEITVCDCKCLEYHDICVISFHITHTFEVTCVLTKIYHRVRTETNSFQFHSLSAIQFMLL